VIFSVLQSSLDRRLFEPRLEINLAHVARARIVLIRMADSPLKGRDHEGIA
jgi:hypothetical protein